MNEKELAEIEARVQALFKGEWVEETDENGDEWIRIPGGHDVKFWNIEGSSGCCYAVTHFITHAREDVPALVAEVRRLTNLVEALEFLTEDETGMLSDAPLTPDKLVEILRLLKDQRDYAAETAEMHAKIVEQLRNEYNLFRYTAKTEIERLRAALADVIHSPKYQTESCGRTIINLSCDISIIEEASNALAGDK